MIMFQSTTDIKNLFWKLEDGRIWSTKEAKFVTKYPEDSVIPSPVDRNGKSSLEGLIDALNFYKLPKGSLVTADDIRSKRNELLELTDKYLVADYPISEYQLKAIKEYRQKLRDITKQDKFPDVVWPKMPQI